MAVAGGLSAEGMPHMVNTAPSINIPIANDCSS